MGVLYITDLVVSRPAVLEPGKAVATITFPYDTLAVIAAAQAVDPLHGVHKVSTKSCPWTMTIPLRSLISGAHDANGHSWKR